MKYEEIVKKVTQLAKKKDVSAIKEHIAMQIDIEGEGEGAFYVEVADSKMAVEPYEYYDRDCKLKSGADAVIALFNGKLVIDEALANGSAVVEGDSSKAAAILNAPKKATARKTTAKKHATKKAEPAKEETKPAAKATAAKTTTAKTTTAKATTAKATTAKTTAAEKKPSTTSTTKKTSTK